MLFYQIGDAIGELCLTSGDVLKIVIEEGGKRTKATGKGSQAIDYLEKNRAIQEKYSERDGTLITQLNTDRFLKVLDSLHTDYMNFHNAYVDSIKLSESLKKLFLKQIEADIFRRKAEHVLSFYSDSVSIQRILRELKGVAESFPMDVELIQAHSGEYMIGLFYYLELVEAAIFRERNGRSIEYMREIIPLLVDDKLRKVQQPEPLQSILLGRNIYKQLGFYGITKNITAIFKKYKSTYGNSKMIARIEEEMLSWKAISKGKPAPDFTGTTPDAQKIALHDLKGKVVYVDVWATWCGPCVEELPYSKKIRQQFENNQEVIFLYASVDSDKQAWLQFLKKDKSFKGLHLNLNENEYDSMIQAYKIRGIPQFFLIDKEGKIVDVRAPRPSSDRLLKEIQELL